jgi:hypothetical protein
MNGVISALFVELALITYRGASANNSTYPINPLPVPAEYAGALIVFGALSIVPGRGQIPAAVFAWGLVVATALNFYGNTPAALRQPLTFIAPGTVQAEGN